MDRVETRELAYFVAVAEELHFGRAAGRLGMAQPPLSRAIRQLERRLGVELLIRNSRGVRLTEAGEVLLHEGRKALDAVEAAVRRAQRAGEPERKLVVVMKPNGDAGLLGGILQAYQGDPEALPVEVEICRIGEQAGLLREGRADVALLHDPYDDLSGFDTEELLTQRSVAVLPRTHGLARRRSLHMADLAGETMPRWPGLPGDGPEVRDTAQMMQLIALGRMVAVMPEAVRRNLREELVAIPVLDGQITTVVLAWPERSRSRAVAAFVRAAVGLVQAEEGTTIAFPAAVGHENLVPASDFEVAPHPL
ncbi:LysR family transcriptional regulator [Kutzneria sp. 744]|uniref:LysR family transcriptional regulator n=1 Tax=Kutzneria sp. (strain 744) TaxID=345341 RepID=UPI0003EEB08D|nr:LysR family transcriptional regulator [Kutzneria sp. 744]EWM17119.1 PE_PGRS family protein [Kutzneria sp. 744]